MSTREDAEQFCELFTEISGHVANVLTRTPVGWLCEIGTHQTVISDEEISDFPGSSEPQKQEIVGAILSRLPN